MLRAGQKLCTDLAQPASQQSVSPSVTLLRLGPSKAEMTLHVSVTPCSDPTASVGSLGSAMESDSVHVCEQQKIPWMRERDALNGLARSDGH